MPPRAATLALPGLGLAGHGFSGLTGSASEFRATQPRSGGAGGFCWLLAFERSLSAGAVQTTVAGFRYWRSACLSWAEVAAGVDGRHSARTAAPKFMGAGNGRLASSQCGDLALERARQAEPKRACEFVTVKGSGRGGNAEQDICLQNRVDLARMSATLPPASERDLRAIPPRVRSDSP